MALNQIYKLTLVSEYDGVASSNSFYYKETVSPSSPDELDVWKAWEDTLAVAWNAITTDNMTITCQISKVVDPGDGPSFTEFNTSQGTVGGDSLPSNAQIPFSSYAVSTEAPPRLRRNGILKSGIPVTHTTVGELSNVATALYDTLRDLMKGTIISPAGGNYDPFLRYEVLGVPTFDPLISYKYRQIIRVVTRRTSNLCMTG